LPKHLFDVERNLEGAAVFRDTRTDAKTAKSGRATAELLARLTI
jgi:hypothetical protein